MNEINKAAISSFIDKRGCLDSVDFTDIPFTPERLFILRNIPPNTTRGEHGHFSTEQYLIVLLGVMELLTIDEFGKQVKTNLGQGHGIHVPSRTWIRMTFPMAAEVLVLASAPFSQDDYYFEPAKVKSQGDDK